MLERDRAHGRAPVRRLGTSLAALALALSSAQEGALARPAPQDASPAAEPAPPLVDLGETYTSSTLAHRFRAFQDPRTGEKRFVDDAGRGWPSIDAIEDAEASLLTPLARVVAPDLLSRMRGLAAETDIVEVVFRLRRQPTAESAAAVGERERPQLGAASSRLREILGRVAERRPAGAEPSPEDESTLLDAAERDEVRLLRDDVKSRIRAMRREVIDRAKPEASADQAALVASLESVPGAVVTARTWALSTVCARLPASAALAIVEAHPEIARAELALESRIDLNTSIAVIGASTWWTAGYDGSTSTRVAVLDTGVDGTHPALTGIVAASAVYLSSGSAQSNFADNASSTDDLQFHGTHCAGIVASNNATYKGVAPGARLLNAKCGYLTTSGGGSLQQSDIQSAGDWACDNGADVLSCSFGGSVTSNGNSSQTMFFDAIAYDLLVSVAVAAGNSGSTATTIESPSDGFNVICVGNFDDAATTSLTDDSIASSSSRGPCSDGRRKPDIAAPGTNITSAYAFWESSSSYVSATGTSMACPHVAGSLAILADAAVATTPEGMKALLVTSCRNTSPAPTSPDNNWGCGGLELSAVYTNRAALAETTMTSAGARYVFVKGSSLASGKRASLVWPRRVISNNASSPSASSSLLDLDLYVYDESDGSSKGSSSTSLNSIEQVKLTAAATTPVMKVYRAAASFPSGLSTQRLAVAAESSSALSVVTAPTLSCSIASVTSPIGPSSNFTVTATVSNSGGIAAQSPSVTLTLPTGYSIVSGSNPQTISKVAAGGSGNATWTVKSASSGSGSQTISASAASTSYGESFTSTTGSATQTLDTTAPTGSVSINSGAVATTSTNFVLTFSATDTGGAGLLSVRWREGGGTWGSWTAYETSDNIIISSGDAQKTVEAQFQDTVGNVSTTYSDTIYLDTTAPNSSSVVVNSGAAWTQSANVTLTLSAADALSGVSEMRFSNNNSTWTSWATYATTSSFTLTAVNGTRTVYAQFRDYAGNSTSSTTDQIGLDMNTPTGTVSVAAGAAWTASTSVTLTLSATDSTSGVADMRFSNDGSTWGSWTTYATSAPWTLTSGDGTKTVYAQFRDVATWSSSSVNDTIGLDGTAPSGTVSIAGGAAWTATTAVTLTLSGSDATSGVAEMRFSNDGSTWGAWTAYASSSSWTLASGDGTKTVSAQFRDTAGNVSSTATDTIGLDSTMPSATLSIASGAAWTTTTSVTLTVTATDGASSVTEMRFSDDNSTWSSWTTYATTAPWTLPASDGTRTVYCQVRDTAGNVSASASDTIGLDRAAPSGSVVAASGAAWTTATGITLTLSASDTTSGVADMRFSNDGTSFGSWTTYGTSSAWTLASGDGSKTVYAQFRDTAGNVSSSTTDTIGLDGTAPSGTLTIASGAAWTGTTAVTLGVSASDVTSGVAEMRFSDDNSTWSSWAAYATSSAWTLPGSDGTKTVYAQFRDTAGNVSSSASDTIGLDRGAPSGTVVASGGAAWTTTTSVTLTLSASDATSSVAEMRFSNDGSTWGSWTAYATSSSWTLAAGDGAKSVSAQFRDSAGNVSATAADAIGLDGTAPSGTVVAAGGAAWTTAAGVTLTLSASDATSGVAEMRFSNDGSTWGSWTSYGASSAWTLASGDGPKTVYAQYRDVAGNVSSSANDAIGFDGTAPSGTLTIASGAAWTGTTSVSLGVSASDLTSGVAEMRFSDDGSTWTAWAACAASAEWTLPGADGTKTVYAQFRDVAGNVSSSASDTIGLDRGAPSGTVVVAADAAWSTTMAVTLTLSASDATSPVAEMRFSNDGSTWGPWTAYATGAPWTLAPVDGGKTVSAQFRDSAGNVSPTATDTIGLDVTAPSAGIIVAADADWTVTPGVTLTLSSSDATSGVAEMRFSNDATTWSSWTAVAASAAWTLASGDGAKTVYVQVRDVAGNVSSAASDAVGLDGTAPSGTLSIASGAAWSATADVSLGLAADDATSGVAAMRLSDDGSTWTAWTAYAANAAWTLPGADGTKTVYAQFRDVAGNVSPSATDSIGLDRGAPSGAVVVAGGAAWTTTAAVALTLSASDATSGVAEMRFSDDGSTWSAWTDFVATASRTLPGADGAKTVHAQFRDAAGNVSDGASDDVGLDRLGPSGTLVAAGDAAWTTTPSISLALVASDATSGVAEMRLANDDGSFGAWMPFANSKQWTLAAVEGTRVVRAEFRDTAGNASSVASDEVGLDTVAPSGTVVIEDGAAATAATVVGLTLAADDATSGVAEMRSTTDGIVWTDWAAFAASAAIALPPGDGPRSVAVQFRDVAGNVSGAASDGVLADRTAPSGSFVLAETNGYLAPDAPLVATLTSDDGAGGSGVVEFRWSHDAGATWSAWNAGGSGAAELSAPPGPGDVVHDVAIEFRDAAGNVSARTNAPVRLLSSAPHDATLVKKVMGALDGDGDVDDVRVDLQSGDRLDVKVKATLPFKKADARIELDLYGPDGSPLVVGRYPLAAPKPGISKFVAAATGQYRLVVRRAGADAAAGLSYALSVIVKPAKTLPIAGGASSLPMEIAFDAAEGRTVSGVVTGAVESGAEILCPTGGPVAVTLKPGKGGTLTLLPTLLDHGSGTYRLRLSGTALESYALRLAPPKRTGAVDADR